ncbi:MAG: ATP-binding protein [Bacteroidaceae bacterium]|nr:ATP-binding protein [Bacteroidaceae bacterium]
MESFFRTHAYLVEHTDLPVRRALMDEIDWKQPLIGIKGTRGVGKTSFLLQYAKKNFDVRTRKCLYINMNNFYFQGRGLADFAREFRQQGGEVLLIDQVFKQPNWSHELRRCHDENSGLRIVFTGSSVMRLKEENPELNGLVSSYNLRGFSFREFLNLKTGCQFPAYSLGDILRHHERIAAEVLDVVNPLNFFQSYLHHGFYPFFLEKRNFSENLLKTMNMMIEVDILLIKQIELKYLTKLKKLLYLLAVERPSAPNVSQLALDIETSRATVMNYIKYLSDARLINMIYREGEGFPRKPARIMMHNSNLMYAIYPNGMEEIDVAETFFQNALWAYHDVRFGDRICTFFVDGRRFRVCMDEVRRPLPDVYYAQANLERGRGNAIPLWLFGFLY